MADFKIAYGITNKNEGGYSFNHDDHGGETYAGISRKFWPNWPGWKLIDQHKETRGLSGIDKTMAANPIMQGYKKDFYKSNFWNPLKLDLVNDQQITNVAYDFGVNAGVGTSVKKLQIACNVASDGQIGSITIGALNNGNHEVIYNNFNALRSAYYHKLALDPTQHQFLASWMSRIKPYIS